MTANRGGLTRSGASLTLRLVGVLGLIALVAVAAFLLVAQRVIANAERQEMLEARGHFGARLRAADLDWQQLAHGLRQQIELWQIGESALPEDERTARLHALMLTVLSQGAFTHMAIVDADGTVHQRVATRSLQSLGLPPEGSGVTLGWVWGERDRTMYRAIAGPLNYLGRPMRLLLYAPLDNALLHRLSDPTTQLELLHEGRTVARSDPLAPAASRSGAEDLRATGEIVWDDRAGSPQLRIDRRYATPISVGELLWIVSGCALVFMAAAWLVLGRWIHRQTTRLQALQQVAAAYTAAPGSVEPHREPLHRAAAEPDDIGVLGRNLLTLMERVESAREQREHAADALARLNAELEDRVAERTRELAQARDEALAAAGARERFLSSMSHEIRTPMNGMLGALDLLSRTPLNARQSEYIQVAATSGEALLSIINDVLDYSKIGAGRLALAREPLDANAVARSVATLFSALAQRKGLELRLQLDPALAGWRLGDALRLRQVLLNLVGNAMKFTQRGSVVVTTRAVDGRVLFEVSDTGIGIERSQHRRIFEAFTQAEGDSAPRLGGTGLGLAISRELVQAMGGTIEVDSAPGTGSTFRFALDLPPAPQPAVQPGTAAPAPDAPLCGRVLLVEDNGVNRLVGSAMLEQLGLEVLLAEDGEQALEVLAARDVDLVLMDCQMPVLDGYAATQRWRDTERGAGRARLPIVALTANALSGDFDRCIAAGMDAYLSKPYTRAQLHATLAPWLAARPA